MLPDEVLPDTDPPNLTDISAHVVQRNKRTATPVGGRNTYT